MKITKLNGSFLIETRITHDNSRVCEFEALEQYDFR